MTAASSLSSSQLGYVNTIVDVGANMGMDIKDLQTAITVALAESEIQVLANTKVPESFKYPHDGVGSDGYSVGIFQQQVGMGWGTVAECMDPAHSAQAFFSALQKVPGRKTTPISIAAQTVQRSGDPTGSNYLMRESQAKEILATLAPGGISAKADTAPGGSGNSSGINWGIHLSWQRVGIFALGLILLGFAFMEIMGTNDVMKAAAKTAVKAAVL